MVIFQNIEKLVQSCLQLVRALIQNMSSLLLLLWLLLLLRLCRLSCLKGIYFISVNFFSLLATNNWLFSFLFQPKLSLHSDIWSRVHLANRLKNQVYKSMHFLRLIKHNHIIYEDKNQYQYLIYIIFQYGRRTQWHKVQEEWRGESLQSYRSNEIW